ncbi:hypothetical protein, partial [Acidaminococcus timonensis]|uniref:hypothetical protein n=1 Tax=Acidaminococcus timonensis TaxID=1871002 RepID=UPI0025E24C10
SGSKIREQVAHFLVDIHINYLRMDQVHSDCSFIDGFSQNHFNMKLHYGFLMTVFFPILRVPSGNTAEEPDAFSPVQEFFISLSPKQHLYPLFCCTCTNRKMFLAVFARKR